MYYYELRRLFTTDGKGGREGEGDRIHNFAIQNKNCRRHSPPPGLEKYRMIDLIYLTPPPLPMFLFAIRRFLRPPVGICLARSLNDLCSSST